MPTGADVTGTRSILLSRLVCLLPCCVAQYRSISGSVGVDQMERCSSPKPSFRIVTHSRSYEMQRAISCDFFYLFFVLLTKTDKGLSFLLACLSSVCLYCTVPNPTPHPTSPHCAPALFAKRCLGAVGPSLGDWAL